MDTIYPNWLDIIFVWCVLMALVITLLFAAIVVFVLANVARADENSDNTLFSTLLVVQRDISSTFQVNLSYRYVDSDYPSSSGFDLRLEGHAPLIGISVRFGT